MTVLALPGYFERGWNACLCAGVSVRVRRTHMSYRETTFNASTELFRTEALDELNSKPWQPPLLSQTLSGLTLSVTVSLSLALLISFAALFPFAQTERANGYLEPGKGWTTLRATRFAVVRDCGVSEGEAVVRGDVLCELSSDDGLAEGRLLEFRLLDDLGERREALIERSTALEAQLRDDLLLLENARSADLMEVKYLENEAEALTVRLEIAIRQHDQGSVLFKSGTLPERDLTELQDRVQVRSAELARVQREIELVESRISSHSVRVHRLESDLMEKLSLVTEQLKALDMEEARLMARGEQRVLSPKAGQVASIQVRAGDSVSPGDALLDIIPNDMKLRARLYADPAAMSTVDIGQPVRVYIDALPYEHHGAQTGVIESISKTTFPSDRVDSTPAYRIRVVFPEGFDPSPEHVRALRPGMTVSADLIQGHATLLDWLTEPLRRGAERL